MVDKMGRCGARAGFAPQAMNPRLNDDDVLVAAALVVRRCGRFPTAAEIRFQCTNDPELPSHNTFRRFGGLSRLRDRLLAYAQERQLPDLVEMIGGTERESSSPLLEDGFVYLIKSGRHFKIGKANTVENRFRQLRIQLPQAAEVVHRIRTDDAFGIERYWHERFADKHLNGEWFSLTAADVKAFKRRKFM